MGTLPWHFLCPGPKTRKHNKKRPKLARKSQKKNQWKMKMKMNYQKLIKTLSNLFVKESNDFNEKTNIKKTRQIRVANSLSWCLIGSWGNWFYILQCQVLNFYHLFYSVVSS